MKPVIEPSVTPRTTLSRGSTDLPSVILLLFAIAVAELADVAAALEVEAMTVAEAS